MHFWRANVICSSFYNNYGFCTNSPWSMYEGVRHTVLSRKVVVTNPVKILVCMSMFSVHCVSRVFTGPGVTSVSEKGIDPSVLGSSVVNCMWRSVGLIYYKNWTVCEGQWSWYIVKNESYILSSGWQRFHQHTLLAAVLMAFFSNFSTNRMMTMGLMGDQTAASWVCS